MHLKHRESVNMPSVDAAAGSERSVTGALSAVV